MSELYNVEFEVINNNDFNTEYLGFEATKTAGYFEPSWGYQLLFHDIFEHWFEFSEYFSTEGLSQAGECVAMGIREYLHGYSNVVSAYAGFNGYQEVQWNSWNVIGGGVWENLEQNKEAYGNQYPNDFNFKHLPEWDGEIFEIALERFFPEAKDIPKELQKDILRAYSYGYWLGEKLFWEITEEIDSFMKNLKAMLTALNLGELDIYDMSELPIDGEILKVSVQKQTIEANFLGITWSDKTDTNELINLYAEVFNKINEYETGTYRY